MESAPSLLLIEDNEGHRYLIEEKFRDAFPDAEIFCAGTLRQASDILPTKSWDMVIMNAKLPDGGAIDFLEVLSTRQPFAAVAILTEDVSGMEWDLSRHHGAVEFLTKDRPTLDSFVLHVKRLMAASRRINRILNHQEETPTGLVFRDPVTGLYNRAYFEDAFRREVARANRYRQEIGLMVIDIDRFEEWLAEKGAEAEQRCLKRLSLILTASVRVGDIIARYDDHQFVILLTHCRKSDAVQTARRVLKTVQEQAGSDPVTVSIGLLHYRGQSRVIRPHQLLSLAEKALHEAQTSGGARMTTAKLAAAG